MSIEFFGEQQLLDLNITPATTLSEITQNFRILAVLRPMNIDQLLKDNNWVIIFKEHAQMKAASVHWDNDTRTWSFLGWLHPALAIDRPSLLEMKRFCRLNYFKENVLLRYPNSFSDIDY